MNTKLIFLLMLAIGCGTIAAVAGSQMMNSQPKVAVDMKMTDIWVASENLTHGTQITKERFKLEKWPTDRLPEGAVSKFAEVDGKFTNQPLYVGEPLLARKVMNSVDFVSTKIPSGYKVFDMPIGDSDYIRPGDHVDIFGYFQKSATISQTRSMRILQNVTVLMVDGVTVREVEEGSSKSAKTAQLLIKDSQYEALTTASNLGKLRMALCGLSLAEQENAEEDTGSEFLNWVDSSVGEGNLNLPTAGAPPFPQDTFVSAPAPAPEPVDDREEHSMVVYSGGFAREFKWYDDELPMEVGGPKKPAAKPAAVGSNSTPPGKFTGTNTVWDPANQEWGESDFKPTASPADAQIENP